MATCWRLTVSKMTSSVTYATYKRPRVGSTATPRPPGEIVATTPPAAISTTDTVESV